MISPEHRKHPKLARPKFGHFARQEWAILGAPCSKIQALAQQVIANLSKDFQCAYVDASHHSPDMPAVLATGASMEYTDAIQYRQLTDKTIWGPFQYRTVFNSCDVVLVNGNHQAAVNQVVILDPAKADSLKRRIGQLTNVCLLLLTEENTPVFDFLMEALPEIENIPKLMLTDTEGIVAFFEKEMQQNIPKLNGLVLAGGQSIRMGRDKGAIEWHGVPQREYLMDMLRPFCSEVFISCRPEQQQDFQKYGQTLPDTFVGLGPFGALLSAFRAQPDCAWLVVACDLPLLDQSTLDFLIAERCIKKVATAFQSPTDQMPEPLITIWEPKAYAVLLSFLAQGYSCPRKVLMNADAQILTAPVAEALQNVNTPEDLERMLLRPEFKL